jgi:hypothetical protein
VEDYNVRVYSPFVDQLTDEENSYWHVLQNNATAHTAKNSMGALHEAFGERVINRGFWPPREIHLNP